MTALCIGGCGRALSPPEANPRRVPTGYCRSCCAKSINRDPAIRARAAASHRRNFDDPAFRARHHAAVVRGMRALAERMLDWCPADYRPLYRSLTKRNEMRAAEAKAAVLAQVAADKLRRARPKTFAEQLAAVERGAGLVEVVPLFREFGR